MDHVDLKINTGAFVAVMGPSGSGKSTLMNIIGCLDTPDGGKYRLLDLEVAALGDDELSRIRNSKIGFFLELSPASADDCKRKRVTSSAIQRSRRRRNPRAG